MNLIYVLSLTLGLTITTFNQTIAQKQSAIKSLEEQVRWKTYVNNKYAFSFRHPSHWIENGPISEVINLKGEVTGIILNFYSRKTETSLMVSYYLPPNGKKLYDYTAKLFELPQEEGTIIRKTTVADRDAFQSTLTTTIDGKGNKLSKPHSKLIVEFLDKEMEGEFKIEFTNPNNNSRELELLNKCLSSFKFK